MTNVTRSGSVAIEPFVSPVGELCPIALRDAVVDANVARVARLLEKNIRDIEDLNYALSAASRLGYADSVRLLLNRGVNDGGADDALTLAAEEEHVGIVKLLLARGVSDEVIRMSLPGSVRDKIKGLERSELLQQNPELDSLLETALAKPAQVRRKVAAWPITSIRCNCPDQ